MSSLATTVPDGASPATATDVLVRVSDLSKAFGATQALSDASFVLRAGEVHALVGENGSGKSTLVKILSGVHAPDGGSLELLGARTAPSSPGDAQRLGIATVFQEVLVAEARSVLDNVWLGVDGLVRTRVAERLKRERASALLEHLLGRALDVDAAMESLSLSDRQACCIVRSLLREPRVLILDEATSSLDTETCRRLFELVGKLSASGVGVIFITHRMDELNQVADRITVMRSGCTVGTLERDGWTPRELAHMMIGSDRLSEGVRTDIHAAPMGDPILTARGLKLRRDGIPFDVEIHPGELIGVAGLEGHGQDAFLEALWGMSRPVGGEVVALDPDGRPVRVKSPAIAAAHGIAYVPRERGQSTFRWMSIRENFGLPTLVLDSVWGWLRLSSTRERLARHVDRLNIRLGDEGDPISTLSGGNQQKVTIARWLAANPRVLLLNDPTRGIDIGAKRDLYKSLTDMAADGLAVVMLSSEIDEHIELMDRVLVFREHELFCEIPRDRLSRRSLVAAFFGQDDVDG
jgi:ABC-type sugar transport system ATPase subunit